MKETKTKKVKYAKETKNNEKVTNGGEKQDVEKQNDNRNKDESNKIQEVHYIKRYNIQEIENIVLENIIKMLSNRKILDMSKLKENIEKVKKSYDDGIYRIKGTEMYYILLNLDNNPITKSSLSEYTDNNLILVSQTLKIRTKLISPNIEWFTVDELMVDLFEVDFVYKHEKLTEEEANDVLEQYKKNELQKILITDPVAKYLNLQKGDICMVERPSETSGFHVAFKIII